VGVDVLAETFLPTEVAVSPSQQHLHPSFCKSRHWDGQQAAVSTNACESLIFSKLKQMIIQKAKNNEKLDRFADSETM
jgi:hypothetical protein